jgi:hypothetical protein
LDLVASAALGLHFWEISDRPSQFGTAPLVELEPPLGTCFASKRLFLMACRPQPQKKKKKKKKKKKNKKKTAI